ncbi:hypothetical protein JCGZ_13388 [Jatropha curcas]|uniref:Aminoacyl-tRNA synthetase class II (D/K/N) domain-containing protein n=1 Tax=Jatropha curcas TaxID=180498 RepID=A0A067KBQ8_JATCU|nr:hypothetical protein JCGZ_13388 [Jatropha curcas]
MPLYKLQSMEERDPSEWIQVQDLTEKGFTVQCVVTIKPGLVSRQMFVFVAGISLESIIDVRGFVSVPSSVPICGTTQKVEVQVSKLHCISRASSILPINVGVASSGGKEALQADEQLFPVVNQDTCASEGGASAFKLDYKGQPACLAQSHQLHKQMAICGDKERVFEVGSVFKAEESYTPRHLCEFVGHDVEMEIKKHYSEVMDVVDRLFITIFDYLNEHCKNELEAVQRQHPFEPLKVIILQNSQKYLHGFLFNIFAMAVLPMAVAVAAMAVRATGGGSSLPFGFGEK